MSDFNVVTNPAAGGGVRTPYGGALGTEWRSLRAGTRIGANQSAPTSRLEAAFVAGHRRAIVAVRLPVGTTAVKLNLGRWSVLPPWAWSNGVVPAGQTAANGHEALVAATSQTFTGVAGQVFTLEVETFGEGIVAWVDGIVGVVDAADSVQLWIRAAG